MAYSVKDLFDLPAQWSRAFDLVVEIYTVQALPLSLRERAIAPSRVWCAGRYAVVIQAVREDTDTDPAGPPWPLTRAEVDLFAAAGLERCGSIGCSIPTARSAGGPNSTGRRWADDDRVPGRACDLRP